MRSDGWRETYTYLCKARGLVSKVPGTRFLFLSLALRLLLLLLLGLPAVVALPLVRAAGCCHSKPRAAIRSALLARV